MKLNERLPQVAAVLAVLALIGVVVNVVLVLGNQKIEAEVQGRQQVINQSLQLNQVGNALVQSLGAAAVNGNDASARDLLAEYGITATSNATSAGPAGKTP